MQVVLLPKSHPKLVARSFELPTLTCRGRFTVFDIRMEPQWKALSKRAISDAQAARFLQEFVRKHGAGGMSSHGNSLGHGNDSNHFRNRDSHFGFHASNSSHHATGVPNVANPKGVAADARAVYQSVASAAAAANAASAARAASASAAAATSADASPAPVKREGHSVTYENGGL